MDNFGNNGAEGDGVDGPIWASEAYVDLHPNMDFDAVRHAVEEEVEGLGDFHLKLHVGAFRRSGVENTEFGMARFDGLEWLETGSWNLDIAHGYEYAEGPLRVSALFKTDDADWVADPKLEEEACFGDGVFLYDASSMRKLMCDGGDDAVKCAYGLVVDSLNVVLPITDDSVIGFKTYLNGAQNVIEVRSGLQMRERHERYALFYGDDPKDEPLVRDCIDRYETLLRKIIDEGLNPHTLEY